jgi:hypothetical protein
VIIWEGSFCIYSGVTKNWKSFLKIEKCFDITISDHPLSVQTTTVRNGRNLLFEAILQWSCPV